MIKTPNRTQMELAAEHLNRARISIATAIPKLMKAGFSSSAPALGTIMQSLAEIEDKARGAETKTAGKQVETPEPLGKPQPEGIADCPDKVPANA